MSPDEGMLGLLGLFVVRINGWRAQIDIYGPELPIWELRIFLMKERVTMRPSWRTRVCLTNVFRFFLFRDLQQQTTGRLLYI